jgi:hypothetical protein
LQQENLQKPPTRVQILDGHDSSAGMFIADSSRFLRVEANRPDAHTCSESGGFSVYSNSKPSVDSLESIFESL